MNILPCDVSEGGATFRGYPVPLEGKIAKVGQRTEIGIRPEYVHLSDSGIPATVRKAADIGRHTVVEAMAGDIAVNAIVEGTAPEAGTDVHLSFEPNQTRVYSDGWIATEVAS